MIVPAIADAPTANRVSRIAWSFSVSAFDVLALCRVLSRCALVDVRRCAAVVDAGRVWVRVDITLPAERRDQVLHHVVRCVRDAQVGRIRRAALA